LLDAVKRAPLLQRVWWALQWRLRLVFWAAAGLPRRLAAWLAFHRNRSRYQVIGEHELRQARKSDTVFIFGSGYSLNDITPAEWRAIEAHDTVGFNWFVHQQFVRCDFHMVREIGDDTDWRPQAAEYFGLITSNPRFARTTFLVQTGFKAVNGNRAIGHSLLPDPNPVYLFRSYYSRMPSPSLAQGLVHTNGTVSDCVNFAALLGWRTIVLCGVDLYDRRYFWLRADEPRHGDTTIQGHHNTVAGGAVSGGIVDSLAEWRRFYQQQGISLYAYNPRSLLIDAMPVWEWPAGSLS